MVGKIVDVALVVGLLILMLLVFGCGGDAQSSTSTAEPSGSAEPAAEQRCVDLWNSLENEDVRSMVGSLSASAGDVYFAVGFNENFADKCLYTMATATGAVSQFSEVGSGPQGPISIVTLG